MLPPGPRTPRIWQTFRYASDPRAYSLALTAAHGRVTRYRALNGDGVSVADPEIARLVFAADPDTFVTASAIPELFGARAVIATSGEVHRRQRKLLNPRFHGARMKAFLGAMERVVDDHLEELAKAKQESSVIVMTDFGQALTLDVILETVFGDDPDLDRDAGRDVLLGMIAALSPITVFSSVLRSSWFPPWRRFLRRRAAFDVWVDGLIAERRKRDTPGNDILGVLLEARYEDGTAMEESEIRDHLMTLLIAGHETTAVALAWAIYWLLREPPALARLRDDLASLGADASLEAIVRLPWLGAIISETLRIEPIVTDVPRLCRTPLNLGEWTVPAGESVMVNVSAMFADEAIFHDPTRFLPERFMEKTYTASQFMPFGGGSRRCLGAAFAEAELAIAIRAIVTRWDLALADEAPERAARRHITMGPARGVRVKVTSSRALASR